MEQAGLMTEGATGAGAQPDGAAVGKAGFRLYERQAQLQSAGELMGAQRVGQLQAIRALREFAEEMQYIEESFSGKDKGAAFELIRKRRPYALVRIEDGPLYSLVDRGYADMTGIGLSHEDIKALRMQQWHDCGQTSRRWTEGGFPVIDDGFSMEWLAEGAGLVQSIADALEAKLRAGC